MASDSGYRTFEDVLYSEQRVDRDIPDGWFPGDRDHEIAENVKAVCSRAINSPDQVAVPPTQIRPYRDEPYDAVVCWHQRIVRGSVLPHRRGPAQFQYNGYELQQTYRAAYESDRYDVELVNADYEVGDVTIRATTIA